MVSTLVKLCQLEGDVDFPPHIINILSPEKAIPCTEILCRLLHVCMIEVGFIPVINGTFNEDDIDTYCNSNMNESIQKLVESLKEIIDKNGNLHNVNYRAITVENGYEVVMPSGSPEAEHMPSASISLVSCNSMETTGSIPVTPKDSGDSTSLTSIDMLNTESPVCTGKSCNNTAHRVTENPTEQVQAFSENISVSIIHEGLNIFVVANSPRHSKTLQLSLPQYIHPKSPGRFPLTATFAEYKSQMYFSAIRFVDDVKRNFCYPIMDEIDGNSFEIRSLTWFPPEIIVEIAKRCSPVAVFRLRATSAYVRGVLGDDNQQFWKMLLTRDFPQCNTEGERMKADSSAEKYFRKYVEMCNFTLRPRYRRLPPRLYPFPFYFLNNF